MLQAVENGCRVNSEVNEASDFVNADLLQTIDHGETLFRCSDQGCCLVITFKREGDYIVDVFLIDFDFNIQAFGHRFDQTNVRLEIVTLRRARLAQYIIEIRSNEGMHHQRYLASRRIVTVLRERLAIG